MFLFNYLKSNLFIKIFIILLIKIISFNQSLKSQETTYQKRFEKIILEKQDVCYELVDVERPAYAYGFDSKDDKEWLAKYATGINWIRNICYGDNKPILVYDDYAEQGSFNFPQYLTTLKGYIYGLEKYSVDITEEKKNPLVSIFTIRLFSKFSNMRLLNDTCYGYDVKNKYCYFYFDPSSTNICDTSILNCYHYYKGEKIITAYLKQVPLSFVYKRLIRNRDKIRNRFTDGEEISDTERIFFLNSKY